MEELLANQPMEYEEVVLKRSKSNRRLGLTLCYGGTDDSETDIFVSEIEQGSIADKDGRVRIGDQILQINGATIGSRKDAMAQFAKDIKEISLLLARSQNDDEDDDEDEDEIVVNECRLIEPNSSTGVSNYGSTLSPLPENDDGQSTEKDSGLSRATDSDAEPGSSSHYGHSPAQPPSMDMTPTEKSRGQLEESLERELAHLHREMETIRLECDRLMTKRNTSEMHVVQQVAQASTLMDKIDRLSSIARHKSQHNPASRHSAQRATSNAPGRYPSIPPPMPPTPSNGNPSPRQLFEQFALGHRRPQEETSSAYNTGGDSCRSTPMKGEYARVQDTMTNTPPVRRPLHLTVTEKCLTMTPPSPTSSEHPYHTIETPVSSAPTVQFRLPRCSVQLADPRGQAAPKFLSVNGHSKTLGRQPDRNRTQQQQQQPQIDFRPGDIMYTSPEKLADTIALQQRLLRQAMIDQAHQQKPSSSQTATQAPKNMHRHPSANNNGYHQAMAGDDAPKYEWKVKRRPDGTRYITRRPLRSRVLKAREEQLNKERVGLSTDDDAASELKTGKFWSREERKRHLERTKERKRRHHQLVSEKVQNPTDKMILQMSHRKQMRRTGAQLFDKFTTIQEFLAHGSRDPSNRPIGGILSVTTV